MAGSAIIPHENVPTTDIGLPKLKEAVMLFNENFKALDSAVSSNNTAINNLDSSKADADHNHDGTYAEAEHEHTMQEINLLQENLDLKAPLVHTHDQYLTEVPQHFHEMSDVNSLSNSLLQKSDIGHTHDMTQVDGLNAELASINTAIAGKAVIGHTHEINQVNGLQSALDGKAAAAHGHSQSDITDLEDDLEDINDSIEDLEDAVEGKISGSGNDRSVAIFKTTKVITPSGEEETVYSLEGLQEIPEDQYLAVREDDIIVGNLIVGGEADTYGIKDSGIEVENSKIGVEYVNFGDDVENITTENISDYAISPNDIGDYAVTPDNVSEYAVVKGRDADITNNTSSIADHETRIAALENAPHGGGTVTSVDGVTPVSGGNVVLNAVKKSEIGQDDGVQAYSAKLTSLASNLSEGGKVPLTQISGNVPGHQGSCYVTIDNDGALSHSGNKAYNLLNNAAYVNGSQSAGWRENSKLITDIDIADGLEADSTSHNLKVKAKAGGGITVDTYGISAKLKSDGGLDADANGVSVKLKTNGGLKADAEGVSVEMKLSSAAAEDKVLMVKQGETTGSFQNLDTDGCTATPKQLPCTMDLEDGATTSESWDRGSNPRSGVSFRVCTRCDITGSGNLLIFFRELKFDSHGRLTYVSNEIPTQNNHGGGMISY